MIKEGVLCPDQMRLWSLVDGISCSGTHYLWRRQAALALSTLAKKTVKLALAIEAGAGALWPDGTGYKVLTF